MISLRCPACNKALKVKPELAGRKVKCPGCARVLPVPLPDRAAEVVQATVPLASVAPANSDAPTPSLPVTPERNPAASDDVKERLRAEQAALDLLLGEIDADVARLRREVRGHQRRAEEADGDRFAEAFKEGGKNLLKAALLAGVLGSQEAGIGASAAQNQASSEHDRLTQKKKEEEKAKEAAEKALKLVRGQARQLRQRRWALGLVDAPAGLWVRWVEAVNPSVTQDVLLAAAALAALPFGNSNRSIVWAFLLLGLMYYLVSRLVANWLTPVDRALTDYPLRNDASPRGALRNSLAFTWAFRAATITLLLVVSYVLLTRFLRTPETRRWLKAEIEPRPLKTACLTLRTGGAS